MSSSLTGKYDLPRCDHPHFYYASVILTAIFTRNLHHYPSLCSHLHPFLYPHLYLYSCLSFCTSISNSRLPHRFSVYPSMCQPSSCHQSPLQQSLISPCACNSIAIIWKCCFLFVTTATAPPDHSPHPIPHTTVERNVAVKVLSTYNYLPLHWFLLSLSSGWQATRRLHSLSIQN